MGKGHGEIEEIFKGCTASTGSLSRHHPSTKQASSNWEYLQGLYNPAPPLCHISVPVLREHRGIEDISKGFTASTGTKSNYHHCSTGHAGFEELLQGQTATWIGSLPHHHPSTTQAWMHYAGMEELRKFYKGKPPPKNHHHSNTRACWGWGYFTRANRHKKIIITVLHRHAGIKDI